MNGNGRRRKMRNWKWIMGLWTVCLVPILSFRVLADDNQMRQQRAEDLVRLNEGIVGGIADLPANGLIDLKASVLPGNQTWQVDSYRIHHHSEAASEPRNMGEDHVSSSQD